MSPDADGLVDVLTNVSEWEALVVKGLLESGGIDAKIVSLEILQSGYRGAQGALGDAFAVRVNAEQAEDALALIAGSQDSSKEEQ